MPRIYNRIEYNKARKRLRHNRSHAEIILWGYLRGRRFWGEKFRRQHGIGRYVVDFYCPALKLALEVDGDSHAQPKTLEYDRIRTAYLQSLAIHVVRFTNNDVFYDLETVLNRLKCLVLASRTGPPHTPPHPRRGKSTPPLA